MRGALLTGGHAGEADRREAADVSGARFPMSHV